MAGYVIGGEFLGDVIMRNRLWNATWLLNIASGPYYRTARGGVIDGFGTADGVTGQTSGSYGAKVFTSQTPATTSYSVTLGSNSAGSNTTFRFVIAASAITVSGSKIRLTLQGHAAGTINDVFFGQKASSGDAYDFETTPTRITFNGGSSSVATINGAIVSDVINFTLDETKDHVISVYQSGTVTTKFFASAGSSYAKAGSDAATQNATGYSTNSGVNGVAVSLIEVVGDYELSVPSIAYTVSSAPSQIYIVGIVDLGSATLNTDLTLEVSRNNGSNWSTVTLVDLGTVTGNQKLVGAVVTVSGQPSGTTIKWRWTQINNKLVSIYGTSWEPG